MKDLYTGYQEVFLNDEQLAEFYQSQKLPDEYCFGENEYVLLKNESGIIDFYCMQNGKFRRVSSPTITNRYTDKISPRNPWQYIGIDMLQDRATKVKLLRGVYGSGKDLLMLNEALSLIEKGEFQKIVFIRPNVTVANVPEIGYLKGDVNEKLGWTLGPIYDKVGGIDGVERLVQKNYLELVPLLFIRGRSFENSIVYVCEGQNITTEIAKLIISRVGEGSELWINADNHQTDKRIFDNDNGITKIIEKLKDNKLFGYVYLPKTERGDVANLANLLDE